MSDAVVRPVARSVRRRATRGWSNYAFVAPYLIVYVLLLVLPLFAGLGLSLFKADLFGIERFVGLANFTRLFGDALFLGTVVNTLYFVVLTVPALTVAGLALALALNRQTKLAAALRAVFFCSTVLSVTVVTLIWRMVLTPDGGLVATGLEALGRSPIPFLNDTSLVMPAMVLFLSALQQVPRDLYEAAALDNAGRLKTLFRITLPSISRTFVLVLIIEIILQFQLFGQPQLMTLGGPNNASRPIVLFIYETGFRRWDLGYAAAASQVLFGMILIAAMAQYFLTRRKDAA